MIICEKNLKFQPQKTQSYPVLIILLKGERTTVALWKEIRRIVRIDAVAIHVKMKPWRSSEFGNEEDFSR